MKIEYTKDAIIEFIKNYLENVYQINPNKIHIESELVMDLGFFYEDLIFLPTDIAKLMLKSDKNKLDYLDEIELQNILKFDNNLKTIKDLYENVEKLIMEFT